MKKLMVFTNHYDPEIFRINALSKEFSKSWDLSVITQVPNYPQGSFFHGYSNFKKRKEIKDNIEIIRLPVIPRKRNSIMLMLNYISYVISSFFFGVFTKRKVDHVFAYVTSPIFISWSALRVAKRNKVKASLYLLDLWPDSLIMALNIKNKFIIKRLEKLSIKIYNRFDTIIVSSESFMDALEEKGIERGKMKHIPQHADEISEHPLDIVKRENSFNIVFTGNLGTAQGLELLIDSIEVLKQEQIENVHVTLVGDGRNKDNLEALVNEKDLSSYFSFVGRVPFEEVKDYLSQNHVAYLSLKDINPLNKTLPAKAQSYTAYGMPILGCGDGEIEQFIKKVDCGLWSQNNSQELSKTIKKMMTLSDEELHRLGYNGHRYSKENYTLDKISKDFMDIMKEGL